MPWICNFGICPDTERECEDCEHYSEENEVYWVDRVQIDKEHSELCESD